MSQGKSNGRSNNPKSIKSKSSGAKAAITPIRSPYKTFTQRAAQTTNAKSNSTDLSGSPTNPAENEKKALVPAAGSEAERERAQAEWNGKLLKEGETRIFHRRWLFRAVAAVSCVLFGTFLYYLYWANDHPYRNVDHMVLWLLAAMPMGSIFILVKLSNEPAETSKPIALMWPEEAIKIGHKLVDVVADILKDRLKSKGGGGS